MIEVIVMIIMMMMTIAAGISDEIAIDENDSSKKVVKAKYMGFVIYWMFTIWDC